MRVDRVFAWGENSSGQCNVPDGLVATRVAAGDRHALALLPDGSVVAWGENTLGQCNVPEGLVATQIAAGGDLALAICPGGNVVGWGNNYYGQRNVPADLIATQISVGAFYSAVISESGVVSTYGATAGPPGIYVPWIEPPDNLVAIQVAVADSGLGAIYPDGTVNWWGKFSDGAPAPVGLTATKISGRGGHFLAIRPDGSVTAWGVNYYGARRIPTDLIATQIAAGGYSGYAIGHLAGEIPEDPPEKSSSRRRRAAWQDFERPLF